MPGALLVDHGLTASTKLVWMLCRMHAGDSPPPASRLAAQAGLTPTTVRAALAQIAAIPVPPGPEAATLPGALLTDPKLSPAAKVLYGILQSQNGEFTYPALSRLTGTGPNTLKRAVAALVQAEWLEAEQRNRLAPVRYTVRNPLLDRQQLEVELARRRLQHDPNKGEALMTEYLSLLVDSQEFEDNARPGMVKVGICALRQIPVVVIHSEDLSLTAMRAKVGRLLPLRDLTGHQPLIGFLERKARRYREEGALLR